MYSILWKISSTSFQFLFNNLLTGYLQIMFHIDEAKQRLPWTATITFGHVKTFKLIFSSRSSKSYTEQCAWLEGICGCLSFYWKISWWIVHRIGAMSSNILHHIVSEYVEKWSKFVEFDALLHRFVLFFFSLFIFFQFKIYSVFGSSNLLLNPFLGNDFFYLTILMIFDFIYSFAVNLDYFDCRREW